MTQQLFPDSVRPNCEHPAVEGGGESERRLRTEMEMMEARCDAGGDGGRTGVDIQEAEVSAVQVLNRTNSSVDGKAGDEMRTRSQGEPPGRDGEGDDGFGGEDERAVL